jgi:Tfp pilus assembly protein PilF
MVTRQEKAYNLIRRASRAQIEGQLDRAARLYRASLSLHPTAEAYTFLAWTFSLRGELEKAITLCRMAIRIDPTFGNPYSDLGAYLIELQRYGEAIQWLKQATQAHRFISCYATHYNLGRIFEHLGEEAKALENYRLSLRHCPDCRQASAAYWRLITRNN